MWNHNPIIEVIVTETFTVHEKTLLIDDIYGTISFPTNLPI
jgi:hypothetical protein